MKTNIISASVLIFFLISLTSFAQIKIDHDRYKKLIQDRDYKTLLKETIEIRKSKEYGKNWIIDYYIGIGFCRSGQINSSNKAFDYILNEYPDNSKMTTLINKSKNNCTKKNTGLNISDIEDFIASNNWQGGGTEPSVVRGKLGYVLNCNKDIELYEFKLDFNQEELQNRLFEITDMDRAIRYYKNFLPKEKYNVAGTGRFIFITPENKSIEDQEIQKIALELENTYQFYSNYYSLRPPNKLITVYLMGNSERLKEVAKDTHGLIIPKDNYGYSCLADLSVLGNSSSSGLGTIKHELFHLMVRTDIGDIPGWLDEGIACLYEESKWEQSKLVCNDIVWRTAVLKLTNKIKNPLPAIRAIIHNNWNEFTPNSAKTICELSMNYALNKHFIMFLDEKEMLPALVDSFKNRKNVFVDTTYSNQSSIEILQNVMQDSLSNIQEDFDNWLHNKYSINTKREPRDLIKRIDKLYWGLQDVYYGNEDIEAMEEKYNILINKLKNKNTEVQGELLDKCVKFIFDAEALLLNSEPYKDY